MNGRFRKRSEGIPVGTILLLAVLLIGSLMAGLFPRAALAQEEKPDLSLRLLTNDYYTEITAGETKVILLEIRNTGSTAILDIELSAIQPQGWTADFEPDRIAVLNPADSIVTKVTVRTAPKSAQERYEVILRADSTAVHRAVSTWLMVVPPEGRWLWVGGIIAAVVIAAFGVVFWRFGRD